MSSYSSSSSSSSRRYIYDVFPSFCGQDVRKTFLSHFLEGLKGSGINTFIDNWIARSESINFELVRAIKESRIAVVILSRNYASSIWCLNELQLIMKCKLSLGQSVMTIFYDVDPSDVRKQTGAFGKAFEETCKGKTEIQKQRWRQAMTQVATIAGEHSASWASEAEMILKIVADVSNELPSTDFDRLVGIEAHVAKIKSMISLESDEVKIVGVWGPAGIGKTTIAKALYDEVSIIFQLKFYKENAEGRKQINMHDETSLQNHLKNELFSGILDHRNMKIPELGEAEDRLKHQRVLLILDDVPANELKALRGLIQGLRFGSKVIVISEDIRTLRGYGVDKIYRVVFPSPEQALQMFSYSAFGQSSPPRGYLDHANEVMKLIAPYPLGLRVLGSLLRGKSCWTMTMPRLRTYLVHKDNVEEVVRVSYDDLSDKDKMLLYRFKNYVRLGESLNKVILFLAENYWDVEKGIETLTDRGLISKSVDGRIMMHYLVKDIVRRDVLARGHNMVEH